MNAVWLVVPLALIVSVFLTLPVRTYARSRGLVDLPGPRRSHDRPVPRGGGLAVLAALLLVIPLSGMEPVWWMPLWLTLAAIGTLGWVDDHRPVAVSVRLGLQFGLSVLLMLAWGPVEQVPVAGIELTWPWLWTGVGVIALVWIVNLFNFMDGSDGLACVQSLSCGLLFALAFWHGGQPALAAAALGLAAASLGFLFWNRPPAVVFLGDAGSLSLGWMVAALALAGAVTGAVPIWLSFIISSVFVVDATATLADRLVRRRGWYTAHRDHAYQRLIRRGWSHARVLAALALLNALLVLPAVMLALARPESDLAVAAGVAVVLLAGWFLVRCLKLAEHEQE